MGKYTIENIRNVAITGHAGKGKTTLAEAMLFISGATDRLGRVADGNTILDFDAEEKRRKVSISSSMAFTEWRNSPGRPKMTEPWRDILRRRSFLLP